MDKFELWVLLAVVIIILGSIAGYAALDYQNFLISRAAIENGYEQVLEGDNIIWKKVEND